MSQLVCTLRGIGDRPEVVDRRRHEQEKQDDARGAEVRPEAQEYGEPASEEQDAGAEHGRLGHGDAFRGRILRQHLRRREMVNPVVEEKAAENQPAEEQQVSHKVSLVNELQSSCAPGQDGWTIPRDIRYKCRPCGTRKPQSKQRPQRALTWRLFASFALSAAFAFWRRLRSTRRLTSPSARASTRRSAPRAICRRETESAG